MLHEARLAAYAAQNGTDRLTPAQRRRVRKKLRRHKTKIVPRPGATEAAE